MHGGLIDVAEWLGYEVVERNGEPVLRHRQQSGKWAERDQGATAAEQHLYDAVRGLLMTPSAASDAGLRVVAKALGLDTADGVSLKLVLDAIVRVMEEGRKHREAYLRAEALVNELREEVLRADREVDRLIAAPRVEPKGGDRGELVRQVRLAARRCGEQDHMSPLAFRDGVERMTAVVLRLLGEDVGDQGLLASLPLEASDDVVQAVQQLQADRFVAHAPGSRPYERNAGEQNAFAMVVKLLQGQDPLEER